MADNVTMSGDQFNTLLNAAKGGGAGRGSIGVGGTDFLKGLETGAKQAGNAFTKVAEGGINFQTATDGAGAALKNFGRLGDMAGGVLAGLGKYAQESVDAMRAFGKVGAGFGGDAMDMRVQIAGTRMTLEEYGKVLTKNKDLMTSMGGTVERGAIQFNKFSKEFFDNTASENLRMLGMTSEEINGALTIELANRRFSNMEDAKAREAAIASAEAMATEMDKIAKLTGKSREAQQEEQAALQRDGKYQAAIRVAMMNGNKFAAEGMQAAMTTMGKFGAPVQALMKDFVAYGTASKESAATMASLGPAGQQMQEAVAMVKNAKTEEQKIAAQAALQAAERAVTERLASKDFNENAALGIKGFQEVANATTNISAGLDKVAAENNLDLNKAADRKKAAEILDRQAAEAQKKAQGKSAEGVSPGKATTDAVIKFEQAMQNSTAAVQKQVVERLNNQIAPGMQKFADFLGGPTGRFSRENQEAKIKKLGDDMIDLVNQPGKSVAAASQAAKDQIKAGESRRQQAKEEGKSPAAQEAEDKAGRYEARKGPEGGGSIVEKLTGIKFDNANFEKAIFPDFPEIGKRAEGGFIAKPEISMIGEAGPEFVLNMPQMKSLIEGVGLKGVKNFAGTADTKIPTPSASSIDISKLTSSTVSQTSSKSSNTTDLKTSKAFLENQALGIDPEKLMAAFESKVKSVDINKITTSLESKVKSVDINKISSALESKMKNVDTAKISSTLESQMKNVDLEKFGVDFSNQVKSLDLSTFGPTIASQMTKQFDSFDLKDAEEKLTSQFESVDLSKIGPAITTQISSTRSIKAPQRTVPDTSTADEEAFQARKLQAESAVKEAKVYKISSERFVSFLEKDIAAKEQELSATDSERTKRRLEKELVDQRSKLEDARQQVLEDSKDVLEAEKELENLQKETVAKELTIKEQLIAQTNSIAEQTTPLLASKKSLNENEIANISSELQALSEERSYQEVKSNNLNSELDVLASKKSSAEQEMEIDKRDMATSLARIAQYREQIDQTENEEELLELRKKISAEERDYQDAVNGVTIREQELLDLNSQINLKEQEIYDLKEEVADTEAAIQEKKVELIDATLSQFDNEDIQAAPEELPEEPAAQENLSGMDVRAEDGSVAKGIKINPETGETYSTELPTPPATPVEAKSVEAKPPKDAYSSVLDKFFGPMKEPTKATDGVDAAKTKAKTQAEEEAKKKAEAEKNKTPPESQTATPGGKTEKTETKTATPGSKEATLNDVVASLAMLNKQVGQLSFEMAKLPNLMEKSVKATKSLNGNINASM